MTIPANLIAGLLGAGGGRLSLSIVAPGNGANIGNNSAAQAISGVAQSTAGNIATLQYQIDGGAWNNFTFTAAPIVNYSGGNAGQIGAGSHVVTVKATDAAANTATVSSSYSITASPPQTSYSWLPYATYAGQNNYLTIVNAAPNAAVAMTQSISDAHGYVVYTQAMTPLGSTDGFGNFSYTGTASWPASGWSDSVQLYVGGVEVGNFAFANVGVGPSYSYGPSVAPTGTPITLSIANSWVSSTVVQTMTFSPSGRVIGPTVLGSTSATGNFSYSQTLQWGVDTSCTIVTTLNGLAATAYNFIP